MEEKMQNTLQKSKEEIMIKIEDVKKQYKLGVIGGTTLSDELKRWWAKIRKKEDPTRKIGAKNYNQGEKFMALNGVSFEVKKGEAIGLIGHNGAGKSTLLKLLTRVTAPTEGKIYLNGRVASMLEVGTGFHGELTGRENVYMNGAILGMTKKEIDAKMEDIIEFSEVRQFIDTPVKRYSSGMFVKLAFSVAAHLDAEIMLMDEVLAVGDMAFQNKCITKMREVANSGRTIIYVSHNMATIRALCDRCVVLNKGQIEFSGDVEEGISVYLGKGNTSQLIFDYSNLKKPRWYSHNLDAISLKINNKEMASYLQGEDMEFTLKVKANSDVENALFRFEILSNDGHVVTTSFSEKGVKMQKNSIAEVDFCLNTKTLAPSEYFVRMVIFEKNDFGYEYLSDLIVNAFNFEVNIDNDSKDVWDTNNWGHIKYEKTKVLGVEIEPNEKTPKN